MSLLDLMDGDGLWQGGNTPVGDTADDAAVAEDDGADGLGDFLDFGKRARTDLLREVG
jgi:hypothetical protein